MNFLEKFKIKKIKSQDLKKTVEIDPFLYWKKILLIMFFILIFVVAICVVLYYGVNRDMFVNSKSKSEVEELEVAYLKIDKLNQLIKLFDDRENMRKNILESKTTIPDPSIKASNNSIFESSIGLVQNP